MTKVVLKKKKSTSTTVRVLQILGGLFVVLLAAVTSSYTVITVADRKMASSSSGVGAAGSAGKTIRLRSGLRMPAVGYGTCCRKSAKGRAVYESTLLYLKHGGKLIDTAMAYENHREIGQAVVDSGRPRSELWITSKIAPNKVRSYEDTLTAVNTILLELQTSYLDLLLIHSPKLGKDKTVELWRGLIRAKNRGKVRAIGVSNFNRYEILDLRDATAELPEVNQIQLHPWSPDEWKKDFVDWAKQEGVAVTAYTSLGGQRFHSSSPGNEQWPGIVRDLAEKYHATPAQVLLQWALLKGVAVIPGATSEAHIVENLSIPDSLSAGLSPNEAAAIESHLPPPDWFDPARGPFKMDGRAAETPWGISQQRLAEAQGHEERRGHGHGHHRGRNSHRFYSQQQQQRQQQRRVQ